MFSEFLMAATLLATVPNGHPTGSVFTAVTDQYGPLVVKEGRFSVESSIKPWSSWWYPLNDDYLFQARNNAKSPLERYDLYVQKSKGYSPGSADFERTQLFQPHSVAWAGLCDAWAIASIMEREPTSLVHARGVDFRVSDLKSLLLKTYEGVTNLKSFGQRYDGKWDSVYEDIYPDQFHRFMQAELFEKKLPFIMDQDAGVEVWNVPVWKAQTLIKLDPADRHTMHVDTWAFTASPHVKDFEFVGTEQVVQEYTYDLHGDLQNDGNFLVKNGEWTNRSRWDHPDYVTPHPDHLVRRSLNDKVDVKLVDAILKGQ